MVLEPNAHLQTPEVFAGPPCSRSGAVDGDAPEQTITHYPGLWWEA